MDCFFKSVNEAILAYENGEITLHPEYLCIRITQLWLTEQKYRIYRVYTWSSDFQ